MKVILTFFEGIATNVQIYSYLCTQSVRERAAPQQCGSASLPRLTRTHVRFLQNCWEVIEAFEILELAAFTDVEMRAYNKF